MYLVEAADDICYEIMDMEDAYKLKILSFAEASGLMLEVAFTESALSSKQSTIAEKQSGLLGRQKVIIRLADDPAAAEEQLQVVRDQQALALEQMKIAQEQAAIAETIAQIADVVEKDEISAFSASLLGLAKEVVDIAKQLSIIY